MTKSGPCNGRRPARRALSLALTVALGLAVGLGVYVGYGVLTTPQPKDAPGWSRLAELPEPRGETAVAVTADSRLFVLGGLAGIGFATSATVSIFDSGTEAWTAGPPLPEGRHHAAAAAIGNDVYVSGGSGALADNEPFGKIWVLRAGAGRWSELAPMPIARIAHRMVALDGRLYVIGGADGRALAEGSVEPGAVLIYDPGADTWTMGAAIPFSRDHIGVVVVDGEVWAIGGRAGGLNHARVDIYDPPTDTWRDGPALPEPTSGAAEAVIDGRILLSGGEDPGQGRIVDRHWVLNTNLFSSTWTPLAPPPLTVHGAPGANLGGRFVIVGGASRAGGQSNTAWSALTQVLLATP